MRRSLSNNAGEGALPALADLLQHGASADGAVVPPFPATDGTILSTLLTGTWPGENGVVGDRFYRTGSPNFADSVNWTDPGLLQAETLPQAAERAGKQVVAVGWQGLDAAGAGLDGPVIGEVRPLSQTGVLANFDLDVAPSITNSAQLDYDRVDLKPADGWSNAPQSFSPAQEALLSIRSLDPNGANPDRDFNVYVYDSSDNGKADYDHVLLSPAKDASTSVVDLGPGAWGSAAVALSGDLEGQAGFWLNVIDLSPDLSRFRLYYTPISRITAGWSSCGDRAECAEPGGFEDAVNRHIGAPVSDEAAPLEAGLIDPATYVAQGITASGQRADELRYVIQDLGVRPDLLLVGTAFPGSVSRELLTPSIAVAASDSATPETAPTPTAELDDQAKSPLRDSYAAADHLLASGRALLGPEATTLAVSVVDQRPSWMAVDAGQVLRDAGLTESDQPGNCQPAPVGAPTGTPDRKRCRSDQSSRRVGLAVQPRSTSISTAGMPPDHWPRTTTIQLAMP